MSEMAIRPEDLTPDQYFEYIKSKQQTIDDEGLQKAYDACLELINKYKVTGQTRGLRKLMFHIDCIEREREVVKLGVNTFIYRDDIEDYIDNIAKDTVKVIELERYEREIPDDVVEVIAKVKDKFDKLYVVFTDYSDKVGRTVAKEQRNKDPIVFGTFQSKQTNTVIERFYYIGDWVDEYCDLTLDKLITQSSKAGKTSIEHTIKTPEDLEELREQLNKLDAHGNSFVDNPKKKKSLFEKVKTALSR